VASGIPLINANFQIPTRRNEVAYRYPIVTAPKDQRMTSDLLHIEHQGAILRVTLNRPEKRNALSRELLTAIRDTFTEKSGDDSLKIATLTGSGERSFAAGGDLRDLESVRTLAEAQKMAEETKDALNTLRHFPVPVVAMLNGDAMGGGAELAMACDFRVAAHHVRFGFVQGRLNITSAWGGGVDLIRRVGPDRALGILCRAEMMTGTEAMALGVVDSLAGPEESLPEALEAFIAPFLLQSPQVLRGFKAMVDGARQGLPRHALDKLETKVFAPTWVHEDHWTAAAKVLAGKGSS